MTPAPYVVKNFAGTVAFPPLPAGVAVTDLQTTRRPNNGAHYVQVLGSDGNVYRAVYADGSSPSGWATSPAFPGGTSLIDVGNDGDLGVWVTDGTRVKNFNGNVTLPALPAGVTATDLQATRHSNGDTYVQVLGSDGNVYRSIVSGDSPSGWTTSRAFPGATTRMDVNNDGSVATWVTDGTTVKNFAGSTTLPPLPAGVSVSDLQTTRGADGEHYIQVLGSDGNVYRSTVTPDETPADWTRSPALPGTTTLIGVGNDNLRTWVTDGTTIKSFNGNVTLPTLPEGVTATDLQATRHFSGDTYVQVLGSDGNVYRSIVSGGTPSDWSTSRAFPGATTHMDVNKDGSVATWVTGPAC